jgi:hypothetical protein
MMKRIAISLLTLLAFVVPASATSVINVTITTAITTTTTPVLQFRSTLALPVNLAVQCTFVYGSGGTTADAYLQTSLDGGVTWLDVYHCSVTTASLHQVVNLSSNTPVTTPFTPTDGTLAANTVSASAVFGSQWRCKYVSTGTYAGGTTLRIDVATSGLTSP